MGTVFLGRDEAGGQVAVKMIKPEYAGDAEFRARFRGEVERARKVPPFCTAEVLDADPDSDPPYLVIEYVDGPSLYDVVGENGPLHGGSLHSVAVGVAAALAAIHGAGVIHRDLKPRNVLFALGTPKVIDFGISRALEATSRHTHPEEMVGTVAYMAPERIDEGLEQDLTTAVDVFAWGAVVVFAGTGRSPFGGDTPTVTAARILTRPPRLDGLPPYLADLVAAALSKDPAERPTAPALLSALLSAGASAPAVPPEVRRAAEAAQHTGRQITATGYVRRRRRLSLLAAAAAALATTLGVTLVLAGQPSGTPPAAPASKPPQPAAVVVGPADFDPLQRPAIFDTYHDEKEGDCRYDHGFRVTTGGTVLCPYGILDVFPARQTIGVRATLSGPASCAGVWFRVANVSPDEFDRPRAGYRLMVCPDRVSVGVDNAGDVTELASVNRATTTGTAHRIGLVSSGTRATVSIDGTDVLAAPTTEPALTGGPVVLGAMAAAGGRADVRFTDIQLRSGTTPDSPPIPAFVSGDAVLTARLWFLSDEYGSAVVEQTALVSGTQYCDRRHLPATSDACAKKVVPLPSQVRVALPIDDNLVLREYRDGQPQCVDPRTHAGLCRLTDRERFSEWATTNSPFPARLTIRNGTLIELAELELP